MKRYSISLIAIIICLAINAQKREEIALNTKYVSHSSVDSLVKLFSNSEPRGVTFLVSSDLKENSLFIKTNYAGSYNVRLVDYYGRTSIVFKNITSDIVIDLADFKPSIFVMNISDDKNNNLISSQVINLKRRLY
jgi:hypothetical protein